MFFFGWEQCELVSRTMRSFFSLGGDCFVGVELYLNVLLWFYLVGEEVIYLPWLERDESSFSCGVP